MKTQAIEHSKILRLSIVLMCGVAVSGCVSSAIDTPQGLVSSLEQPTATDVLSINDPSVLPTPAGRPGAVESSADPQVVSTETQAAVQTPPTPPVAVQTQTPASTGDIANQRIQSAQNAPQADGQTAVAAATIAPTAPVVAAAAQPRATGLLSALFGNSNRKPPAPVGASAERKPAVKQVASAASKPRRIVATSRSTGATATLPGVSKDRALGVSQSDSNSAQPIQVASAAGLARLTPNGIKTQHAGVDVKCLKPALVRVLKTVERKFGKPAVVTSGYRSPSRNKKARGAKNSLHIYCAAADIQVAGVSKWTLAKYLRSLPGRGGVGTYCHTKSVHIDIGPKRDWNWRCRRKK